jgi:hypothetical protein
MPAATTAGPAMNTWLSPRTMTDKWLVTSLAAPSPATGPSATAITGIRPRFATTSFQPGFHGT